VKKPVLLTVSFGTTYNDSRKKTIEAIENALAVSYPDYEQRRAFTSQIVINKLSARDGLIVDNVEDAMKRLVADGIKDLVVQPVLVINGHEYGRVISRVKTFEREFDSVKYGRPLLDADADYRELIDVIAGETKQYAGDRTAFVFMGHGTTYAANADYARLESMLNAGGLSPYYIGTVEAGNSPGDIIAKLEQAGGITRVVLFPLMIVAGDHAVNDMAGSGPDSWKNILEAKGYEVTPVLRGLGEYQGVRNIFVRHVKEALALNTFKSRSKIC
jgi:sirohydrochlorin cobaltochelatase